MGIEQLWKRPEQPRSVIRWSLLGAVFGLGIGLAVWASQGDSDLVPTILRWTILGAIVMAGTIFGGNLQFRGRS